MKIIAFDIDDVICHRDKKYEPYGVKKYNYCLPIQKNIDIINECYDKGFYIKLYTARGMTTFGGDIQQIEKEILPITKKSLDEWGVKYNELIFGKTHYDIFIDDKNINVNDINSVKDIEHFLAKEKI